MRPVDDLTSEDVRAILDEEIALLPEKYSAPIVLCYLEGKSYEQAARQIGCPKPSLASEVDKMAAKLPPAPKLGEDRLRVLWTDLAAGDASKAHRAIGTLASASKQAVSFLKKELRPTVIADASKIQQWITDLDSDKFAMRQAAVKELEKVGAQVTAPVSVALKRKVSLEARRRLEQILNKLSDVPAPDTLRAIRAITVLERIGSPEAQAVLATLAGGALRARETEEAKASLERLKMRGAKVP